MKKLTLDEIRATPAKDLVDGLRNRSFSLLQSMGFHKLKAEMNFTGFVCWAIIALTGLRKEVKPQPHLVNLSSPGRVKVARILKKAAPCSVKGYFQPVTGGRVIGFNHPSLGEILRFIYLCVADGKDSVNAFVGKKSLFPVNLPWYEAIMPIVHELEEIGIFVMPVITPSTRRKMAKKANAEQMEVIDDLSKQLNTLYLQKCAEFIKANDIIWVAPTATRQRTVFKSVACYSGSEAIEPQTMTLLALALKRAKITDCSFQVVGVVPDEDFKSGLNLFKPYKLGVGDCLSMETAIEMVRGKSNECVGSKFEFTFLHRIMNVVNDLGGAELLAPDKF